MTVDSYCFLNCQLSTDNCQLHKTVRNHPVSKQNYGGKDGRSAPVFYAMNKKTKMLTHGAVIAALYVALTYLQNFLLPGTTSAVIQFRASEALCVLAFFTPAAIPGLTVGCLLFNISNTGTMLLDVVLGTLATLLAVSGMYLTRRITVKGYPLPGMLLPAVFNGLLIGWELDYYFGGGFWLNGAFVAAGEGAVLLTLGSLLYYIMKNRGLARRLYK